MKNLYQFLKKPNILLIFWVLFVASPIFGAVRLYFVVGKNIFGLNLKLISSILYNLPLILSVGILILFGVWFEEYIKGNLNSVYKRNFIVISILSLLQIFTALWFRNLEYSNYPNYLYAHFGMTISQLNFGLYVSSLQFGVFIVVAAYSIAYRYLPKKVLNTFPTPVFRSKTIKSYIKNRASFYIASIGIISLFVQSGAYFLNWPSYILSNKQGFDAKLGGVYKYVILYQQTPADSKVIHPPQGSNWPAIGNQPLVRYFLFPRTLISGALLNDPRLSKEIGQAYFVEIGSNGSSDHWPFISQDKKTVVFDEVTKIKYNSLELFLSNDKGVVYKIDF